MEFSERTVDISAERESVGLNARIEKFDFERAVGDRAVLPDELIQTLLVDDTLAVGVSVGAVISAGSFAVEGHAEPYRPAVGRGA